MREERRREKHLAITEAAYELFATRGFGATSMLAIARSARASNETLYRWYGDKRGLCAAMVKDNASEVKTLLSRAIATESDPRRTLETVAPVLLDMLTSDRAVMLNKAAAADPTGELGAVILMEGRNSVAPLIARVVERLATGNRSDELTDWFLGLLIGDLQTKRIIGAIPKPSKSAIHDRAEAALTAFFKLAAVDREN